MSVTLTTVLRDAKVDAATSLFNTGRILFLTAANAVVVEVSFGPGGFFSPAVAGQSALVGTLVDSFTNAGTITNFRIEAPGETALLTGSVSGLGGGGDIELVQTTFAAGDRFEVLNIVYTQPATEITP
jgi:hypothetical protein